MSNKFGVSSKQAGARPEIRAVVCKGGKKALYANDELVFQADRTYNVPDLLGQAKLRFGAYAVPKVEHVDATDPPKSLAKPTKKDEKK